MDRIMKLPLLLEPAEEGGWVVKSPIIPELITEIDHLDEIDEKIIIADDPQMTGAIGAALLAAE